MATSVPDELIAVCPGAVAFKQPRPGAVAFELQTKCELQVTEFEVRMSVCSAIIGGAS